MTGIVNVSVLPRSEGDICLFPPESFREVFSRDIYMGGGKVVEDLISLGRWAGGTLVVSPLAAYTRLASSSNTYTGDQPAGWHALYIEDPIRGVIPTPIITTVRWKKFPPLLPNGQPNPYYEDLDPVKVDDVDRFKFVGGHEGVDPSTGLETYYGLIGINEYVDEYGRLFCVPVLLETGYTDEGSWRGLAGNYFQFVVTPSEIHSLCSQGIVYGPKELYDMAYTNTLTIKAGGVPLYNLLISPTDYIYEIPVGDKKVSSYYQGTIPSAIALSPTIDFPDYTFGFILGLTSPVNQLFALYANISCFRLFWGNHYVLEFIPSPGGGITYFHFFPFGYTFNSITPEGTRVPVDPDAAVLAAAISGLEIQREFRFKYYDPVPNPDYPLMRPYVYTTVVDGMGGVWSNMRFSPGENVEGFVIAHIKGHVCIFRWEDIRKAREENATVKPLFAFNPYEYVKRNFGGLERDFLLSYFSRWTCPPGTKVGFSVYNLTGRISFMDLCYLPMTVVTRPFLFSPRSEVLNLLPYEKRKRLVGVFPPSASKYFFNVDEVVYDDLSLVKNQYRQVLDEMDIYHYGEGTTRAIPPLPPEDLDIYYGIPYIIPSSFSPDTLDGETPYLMGQLYEVYFYLSRDPGTGVYFPLSGGSPTTTVYDALCGVIWTYPFPLFRINTWMGGAVFNPPPLEFGLSPSLFPSFEEYSLYVENFIKSLGGNPLVTWDVTVAGRRFLPRPPVVLGLEVGRMGVFLPADHKKWVSLNALSNEIGWGSIVQSVSVNLTGRLGENTATIVLSIPWVYSDTPYPVELPPILRDLLVPYNHILVELGYLLDDGTYSLWGTFEGVIRSVSADVSERELGMRRLIVNVECSDVGLRLRQATVTEATVLDGWRLHHVLVYSAFAAGLDPTRHVLSFKGIPLGFLTSFLAVQENALPPDRESVLFYRDYTFVNLIDYPRFILRRGSQRSETVDSVAALSGMEILSLPSPLDYGRAVEFLSRLILPRIGGWELVGDAYELGFVPTGRGMVIQTVPTGFYELIPSWEFFIQKIVTEGELPSNILEGLLSVPVFLPSQPYVRGVMSIRWDYGQWLLPTYVTVTGRRLTGQPFTVVFHDVFNEILQPNSPLFRGFRIGDVSEVPAAFTGLQAVLHALKRYLQTGYVPPLRASMRIVGLPFIMPRQKIALDTPIFGVSEWVVGSVTLNWRAGQLPETQLDLIVPHPFAIGIVGG